MKSVLLILAVGFCVLALPGQLQAYVGPGAGLSAIGALLAMVSSVFVAIFGFIWFPIKRLLRYFKRRRAAREEMEADAG